MAAKSYKKNIIYNSVYRCVVVIMPLITSPYLTRVLGAEKLGIYSSANAFATYFVIFTLLGVNDYGNRTIAQVRDNRDKLSDSFWQIYYLQFFLTFLFLAVYLCSIFLHKKHFTIQLILAIYVLSSVFEINWFAFGLEEFKLTSIRSIITRLGIVACIFLFVRKPEDLWKYTLIITVGNLLSLVIILPLISRYTDFRKPDFKKIVSHVRPNLILFLPIIATSVYQYLSKIMLDSWSTEAEVGFYQNAENIITLPSFITTAIETVLMPYASNLVAKGDNDEALFRSTLKYTSVMSIAMAFGMFAIACDFIPWYLGSGFGRSATLVMMMAPIVFFNSFSTIVRYQYIIPHEMDKENLIAMFSGAGTDIILNLILIPSYGAAGAAAATVASYFVTLLIQSFYVGKRMEFLSAVKSFLPSVLFGAVMTGCVMLVSKLPINVILKVGLELIVGASVFLACTFVWLSRTGDPVFSNLFSDIRKRMNNKN